jgi:hypothetical protein
MERGAGVLGDGMMSRAHSLSALSAAFRLLDANGNGRLTFGEFKKIADSPQWASAMKSHPGYHWGDKQLRGVFQVCSTTPFLHCLSAPAADALRRCNVCKRSQLVDANSDDEIMYLELVTVLEQAVITVPGGGRKQHTSSGGSRTCLTLPVRRALSG